MYISSVYAETHTVAVNIDVLHLLISLSVYMHTCMYISSVYAETHTVAVNIDVLHQLLHKRRASRSTIRRHPHQRRPSALVLDLGFRV